MLSEVFCNNVSMVRKLLFSSYLLFGATIGCLAQSASDTLSSNRMTESTSKLEKSVMTDTQRKLLLFDAGDCFKMSGYMQYAAIGTGALAGVVAIVANNKDNADTRDKIRTAAYLVGGFAVAFELVSITYKIRGGRRLKLAGSADGATIALNF